MSGPFRRRSGCQASQDGGLWRSGQGAVTVTAVPGNWLCEWQASYLFPMEPPVGLFL